MLKQKIKNKTAVVAILGLGHVGYPLASLFAKAGFKVLGYDIDKKRLDTIKQGKALIEISRLLRIDSVNRTKVISEISRNLTVSNKEKILKGADVFIVAVPTPLKENETPNLFHLENTCRTISKSINKDSLVTIESTVYPGATEEVVKPILETSGLHAGEDFHLCFSPERIDPGSKKWGIENIPKIVGGINEKSRDVACLLYSQIIKQIVPVSSLKVAEAAKMLENTFRSVNIALVNDLSKLFERQGIDIWETIDAAATKPFGFLPHYPGPGVGGHCIPKDPFYLLYKARKMGIDLKFIEDATDINRSMPLHVIYITKEALKKRKKGIKNSSFGILGVTYKKDVADVRRTPAKIIIDELSKTCKEIVVFDPLVNEAFDAKRGTLEETIKNKDCIILLVDHSYFRENNIEQKINKLSPDCCVIDTKNFIDSNKLNRSILYRCLGKR